MKSRAAEKYPSLPRCCHVLQTLEKIKAEMAAIRADPDLSDDKKKMQVQTKMQELYAASGCAKLKGALQQIERVLHEGSCLARNIAAVLSKTTNIYICIRIYQFYIFKALENCCFARGGCLCVSQKVAVGTQAKLDMVHYALSDCGYLLLAKPHPVGQCCRREGDCLWTPQEGARRHSREAGRGVPGCAHRWQQQHGRAQTGHG